MMLASPRGQSAGPQNESQTDVQGLENMLGFSSDKMSQSSTGVKASVLASVGQLVIAVLEEGMFPRGAAKGSGFALQLCARRSLPAGSASCSS